MRVEAYNQVAQLYNREKTQKVQNTKQMSTGRDEVQISSMGRDYQIAKVQWQMLRISGKIESHSLRKGWTLVIITWI